MKRTLTTDETETLLRHLKQDAIDKAKDLLEEGWTEDEYGLWWAPDAVHGHHLHDAHRLLVGGEP